MEYWRARDAAPVAEERAAVGARASTGATRFKVVTLQDSSSQLEAIEDEVAALREELADANSPGRPSGKASREEQRVQDIEQEFAERERRYAEDPPDPGWAPTATRNLKASLTELGRELEFAVDAAECRTTMCRASMTWNDYRPARAAGAELVHRVFPGLNCAKSIWLKEPLDRDSTYGAELYLDCTDRRTAGTEDEDE